MSFFPLVWHQYLVLFYEPRKDLALSYSNKIDKTGYKSCRYYFSPHISTQQMLLIKSIKIIEKSINIDFSQQIRLSIFIHFRYNQIILSIVIECYRLSIISIAQAGIYCLQQLRALSPSTDA